MDFLIRGEGKATRICSDWMDCSDFLLGGMRCGLFFWRIEIFKSWGLFDLNL